MVRIPMLSRGLILLAFTSLALGTSACGTSVIDHVAYQVSPDEQTLSIALVFSSNIQTNLAGTIPISTYGDVFLQPYSAAQPFELGFSLNIAAANDNGYVQLIPTSSLPNGVPLGIGYPLVEVAPTNPISPSFDLGAYIDVEQQAWFGAEATFSAISTTNFPVGTAITATFDPDAAGNPSILAYVFGPSLSGGAPTTSGGIAILANVKQLAGLSSIRGHGMIELAPEREVKVSGQHAAEINGTPEMMELQRKFIEQMNRQ